MELNNLTVVEAAKLLGIKPDSVRRKIYGGKLYGVRNPFSGKWAIPRQALGEYLAGDLECKSTYLPAKSQSK